MFRSSNVRCFSSRLVCFPFDFQCSVNRLYFRLEKKIGQDVTITFSFPFFFHLNNRGVHICTQCKKQVLNYSWESVNV